MWVLAVVCALAYAVAGDLFHEDDYRFRNDDVRLQEPREYRRFSKNPPQYKGFIKGPHRGFKKPDGSFNKCVNSTLYKSDCNECYCVSGMLYVCKLKSCRDNLKPQNEEKKSKKLSFFKKIVSIVSEDDGKTISPNWMNNIKNKINSAIDDVADWFGYIKKPTTDKPTEYTSPYEPSPNDDLEYGTTTYIPSYDPEDSSDYTSEPNMYPYYEPNKINHKKKHIKNKLNRHWGHDTKGKIKNPIKDLIDELIQDNRAEIDTEEICRQDEWIHIKCMTCRCIKGSLGVCHWNFCVTKNPVGTYYPPDRYYDGGNTYYYPPERYQNNKGGAGNNPVGTYYYYPPDRIYYDGGKNKKISVSAGNNQNNKGGAGNNQYNTGPGRSGKSVSCDIGQTISRGNATSCSYCSYCDESGSWSCTESKGKCPLYFNGAEDCVIGQPSIKHNPLTNCGLCYCDSHGEHSCTTDDECAMG